MGYSSSARRRITFVQEQKGLRSDYYSSPESFKRFGEGRCKRVTSTMETPSTKGPHVQFFRTFLGRMCDFRKSSNGWARMASTDKENRLFSTVFVRCPLRKC